MTPEEFREALGADETIEVGEVSNIGDMLALLAWFNERQRARLRREG